MTPEFSYRNLNPEEERALSAGLDCIRNFAAAAGKSLSLDGEIFDLDILQELLDENMWRHDSVEAIGAGLAFGMVVKRYGKMKWVRIQDQWGEETSLKLFGYEYFAHPITMLTKRLERGDQIELR